MTSTPPLILVVEDDDDTRSLYKESLDHLGYRTIQASDGVRAIEACLVFKPDFVLMDVSMPGMNGIDATRVIKTDPRTSSSIVIVLTGHGMLKFDEARAAGCDALFCKPFDPAALDEMLRKFWTALVPAQIQVDDAFVIKRCGCGLEHSRADWRALEVCGRMRLPHRAAVVELRHCSCGSSLALELKTPSSAADWS